MRNAPARIDVCLYTRCQRYTQVTGPMDIVKGAFAFTVDGCTVLFRGSRSVCVVQVETPKLITLLNRDYVRGMYSRYSALFSAKILSHGWALEARATIDRSTTHP